MRASFQTLIIPFEKNGDNVFYYIFQRSNDKSWQFISGGGEDDETPIEAAKREVWEETGIRLDTLIKLDSIAMIPSVHFADHESWGEDCYVIPEHVFAFPIDSNSISLSEEHDQYKKLDYTSARELLKWDSNKTALWELSERIKRGNIK